MKTKLINQAIGSMLTAFLLFSTSCEKNADGSTSDVIASVMEVSTDGVSTLVEARMATALVGTSDLTESEAAILIEMREEEKLARDVYYALSAKWNARVFSNISKAENTHMTAVNNLLKYYDVADTIIGETGVFADAAVQTLYNDLVTKGSVSLEEGYKVGALIEDMDIKDLQENAALTVNENILMVFENLERGSRNHLRAFTRQLNLYNITYVPVYITVEEYNAIISSGVETGKAFKHKGGKNFKKNRQGQNCPFI